MATRLLAMIVAMLAAFGGGTWAGWRIKTATTASSALDAARTSATQTDQAYASAASTLQSELNRQAGATATWLHDRRVSDAAGRATEDAINHAIFLPTSSSSCPDVLGSGEFERLYDIAAEAGHAAPSHAGSTR